jgi:hypothetical protein
LAFALCCEVAVTRNLSPIVFAGPPWLVAVLCPGPDPLADEAPPACTEPVDAVAQPRSSTAELKRIQMKIGA